MPPSTSHPASSEGTGRVAVIGPLDEIASDVSAFIEQLGLEPTILGNPPGAGGALSMDRLETLRELDFAIVLPPDAGDTATTMLGIGFLLAVLGRNRICFVARGGSPFMAELEGVLRVAIDDGGLWHLLLAREMRRAGVEVDLNRAI